MLPVLFLCFQLAQTMPPPGPPPPPGAAKPVAPSLSFTARFTDNNSALELTWANTGHLGLYVQLGTIVGRQVLMSLQLHREGGGEVLDRTRPGVIGGRLDPFVLFLPAGARFVHRLPASELYDMAARRLVSELKGENVTVRADFWYQPATQADLRMLEFAAAGIWTGRASAKASLVRPGGARK